MTTEKTVHQIIIGASQKMEQMKDRSVELVVTSPPYPMIEMWDQVMGAQNPAITRALELDDGATAFGLMHEELNKTWAEVARVLIPGGFVCVNIGDATRTIRENFSLYPNHARIIGSFQKLGLLNLPNILWRKPTNAPNKFMGSGMLPSGAYVTLEHEWILIFRKGGKRVFRTEEEKLRRKESAFFWEERNGWFSDVWTFTGTRQKLANTEIGRRSAAYPFELPYRLINMFSLKGDTILDPFLGTGTTALAAIAAQRNSVGYEIDGDFREMIAKNLAATSLEFFNETIKNRIDQHRRFIAERYADPKKEALKHFNRRLNMPVMTSQETEIGFSYVTNVKESALSLFEANYVTVLKEQDISLFKQIKSKSLQTTIDF